MTVLQDERILPMCNASITILALAGVLSAGPAFPRPFESADAAYTFARALERSGLDAVAAVVPNEPGTFVAALYLRGRALLVVSARHPSTERIADRLATHRYREVYVDLLGTRTADGKFYIQDANADGILSALPGSGEVDILQEDGVRHTSFNGDAESQGLAPSEYDRRLAAADARYAHLLTVLTTAVRDARRPRPSATD
jgi:hypothetical protein